MAYRGIVGIAPKDATERAQGKILTSASEWAKRKYTKGLLTAIDRGLAVKVEDRPQDLKAWCSLLIQKEKQQTTATEAEKKKVKQSEIKSTAKKEVSHVGSGSGDFWRNMALVSFFVGIVVLLVIVLETFQAEPVEREKAERKAAEERAKKARKAFEFGRRYAKGDGVPQNNAKAVKWYRMAAEQGHASAQSSLGSMYYYGKGVPQDYAEAVKWSRLAAEQGNADRKSVV